MGLLEQMRAGTDSTFMQVVMALVVVSFIGWFATPQGEKNDVIVTVNGTRIMETDYRRTFTREVRKREQMFQRTLTDAERAQVGEQVRQQIVQAEVIYQQARQLGLEVSDREVNKQVVQIPELRDESGRFDESLYARFLKRQQYTRSDFEEQIRKDLLRAKLATLVYTGATVSEPVLRASYIEQETKLELVTVRVRSSAFEDRVTVDDTTVDAWLATNEADAKARYDADFERLYNHPESVALRVLRLSVGLDGGGVADLAPRAQAFADEVAGGADFAALAREHSDDPSKEAGGELGLRPVASLPTNVRDKLADIEPGAVTAPIIGDADVRIYQLVSREPARVDTFDQVKRSVGKQILVAEQAPVLAARFAEDELLPAWRAAGDTPADLIDPLGLVAVPSGPISTKPQLGPFSPPATLLGAASKAAPGTVLPEVYEASGVLWVGQLVSRAEADMEAFEAERDTIRESVLAQRRFAFFEGWIADAVASAKVK